MESSSQPPAPKAAPLNRELAQQYLEDLCNQARSLAYRLLSDDAEWLFITDTELLRQTWLFTLSLLEQIHKFVEEAKTQHGWSPRISLYRSGFVSTVTTAASATPGLVARFARTGLSSQTAVDSLTQRAQALQAVAQPFLARETVAQDDTLYALEMLRRHYHELFGEEEKE